MFLVLSVYLFIGDFRVAFATNNPAKKITAKLLSNAKLFLDKKSRITDSQLSHFTSKSQIFGPRQTIWADKFWGIMNIVDFS